MGKHLGIAAVTAQVQKLGQGEADAQAPLSEGGEAAFCPGLDALRKLAGEFFRRLHVLGDGRNGISLGGDLGHALVDGRERSVVGDHEQPEVGGQLGHIRHRLIGIRDDPRIHAGVLHAHLQVVRPHAAHEHDQVLVCSQALEIDIPQPADIAAVAFHVVHEEGGDPAALRLGDQVEVLIEAGGVLRQIEHHFAAAHLQGLQASVAGVEIAHRLDDLIVRSTHQMRRRVYGEQVVDHVRTGIIRLDMRDNLRFGSIDGHLGGNPVCRLGHIEGHAISIDSAIPRSKGQGGAAVVALRAMVFAQLAVLAVVVFDGAAALLADTHVAGPGQGQAQILADADGDLRIGYPARDGLAHGVVGVIDQDGFGGGGKGGHDAFLDAAHFADAVQLVAEQVQKKHVLGLELGKRLRKPELVALEHAPIAFARLEQTGCDTGIKIGSRAVAHHAHARCLHAVREHIGDGGLTIRSDHADAAATQFARGIRDDPGVHIQGNLAGEVCRRPMEHIAQGECSCRAYELGCSRANSHNLLLVSLFRNLAIEPCQTQAAPGRLGFASFPGGPITPRSIEVPYGKLISKQ